MKRFLACTLLLCFTLLSCEKAGKAVARLKTLKENSAAATASGPSVRDITQDEFNEFISQPGQLNIVDFHADWCPPCKQLAPVLEGVVNDHQAARLGKINVDQAQELAQKEGVRGIPDVRFYVNGKMVDRFTGNIPKEAITKLVGKHSASLPPPPADGKVADAEPEPAIRPMDKDWLPPGMSRR